MQNKVKKHIKTFTSDEKTEILLVTERNTSLVEDLVKRIQTLSCQTTVVKPNKIPFRPYDYLILLYLRGVPKTCARILKESNCRLLFAESKKGKTVKGTYSWLNRMAQQYDVRYVMAPRKEAVERIIERLFGYAEATRDHRRRKSGPPVVKDGERKTGAKKTGKKGTPALKKEKDFKAGEDADGEGEHGQLIVEKNFFLPRHDSLLKNSIIAAALLLFLAPLLVFTARLALGLSGLAKLSPRLGYSELKAEEIVATYKQWKKAEEMLIVSQLFFRPLFEFPPLDFIENIVASGVNISSVANRALLLSYLGNELSASFSNFNSNRSGRPLEDILTDLDRELLRIETDIIAAEENLGQLAKATFLSLPGFEKLRSKLNGFQYKLLETKKFLGRSRELIPIIPGLLARSGQKKYLLLFQNNTELRPGGGFIGSFGLVTFEQGVLVNLDVEDVYTADGQLKGHVDPPIPIRRYLEQPHWYMRDANFDPDFPTSARQVEWFLAKEMNIKVDGTLAIDLTAAERLINDLGGIYLADYGRMITGENLFLTAQTEAQMNFFPGSTDKRNFLASLARSLLHKLSSSNHLPLLKMAKSIADLLEEKHILVSLHDGEIQKFFDKAGWSGRIFEVGCTGAEIEACSADYFAISEANLGVNKANAYLSRQITQNLLFLPSTIIRQATVKYSNEGSPAFPTGDYRSYLRFYLPNKAKEISVSIDGERVADEILAIGSYQDKKEIGFLLTVPAAASRLVSLQYKLDLNPAPRFLYQLAIQKQQGTGADPLELVISAKDILLAQSNFPVKLAYKSKDSYNVTTPFRARYQTDLSVDRFFRIYLERL